MTTFAFQAVDGKGNKVNKEIDAEDRDDAMAKIKGMGLFPTKIKEAGGGGGAAAVAASPEKAKGKSFTIGGVSLGALTTFTQQLATLQDAGLPIVRSLRILMVHLEQVFWLVANIARHRFLPRLGLVGPASLTHGPGRRNARVARIIPSGQKILTMRLSQTVQARLSARLWANWVRVVSSKGWCRRLAACTLSAMTDRRLGSMPSANRA